MNSTQVANSLYKVLHRKVRTAEINELAKQLEVPTMTHPRGGPRSYKWNEKHIEKLKQLL